MKKIVIHLGLHRTGTSFLQREVFPKFKNLSIISDENLSGNNLGSRFHLKIDRKIVLYALKNEFGDCKIILGIRNKEDWLKSCYNKYCDYGHKSYNKWFNENFDKNLLDFDSYINEINKLFSNVFIYDYYDLLNNFDFFKKNLCDFLGENVNFENININKSINPFFRDILRLSNYINFLLRLIIDRYKRRDIYYKR